MSIAAMLYFSCHVYEAPCPETGTLTDSCLNDKSSSSSFVGTSGTFKDSRESKSYKWVKIGTQIWMAENLKYVASNSKCNDDCDTYGRFYNWETAKAAACPDDWHLPSQTEWKALFDYVNNDKGCDNCEAKHLKAISGNGLDSYGFTALLGGIRLSDGTFSEVGEKGYWWSSDFKGSKAYGKEMNYEYEYAFSADEEKSTLFNVRCIKD